MGRLKTDKAEHIKTEKQPGRHRCWQVWGTFWTRTDHCITALIVNASRKEQRRKIAVDVPSSKVRNQLCSTRPELVLFSGLSWTDFWEKGQIFLITKDKINYWVLSHESWACIHGPFWCHSNSRAESGITGLISGEKKLINWLTQYHIFPTSLNFEDVQTAKYVTYLLIL